jgi:hypothetical protein
VGLGSLQKMPSERDCVDNLLRIASNPRLSLTEIIALGLVVARKWDRARAAADPSANVTANEAARFDNFTQQELDEFRAAASRILIEHTATLPRAGNGWWRGFWQGFAASWGYALSIAIVAIIIRLSGSDLLTLLRELFAK